MNYPRTKLKNFKGHLITKGDKLFIGDLGSYLIFQEDGNFIHYDVFSLINISNLPFIYQTLPFTVHYLPRCCVVHWREEYL